MKNIFYITLLMFGTLCNAQTVTLESMAQYEPGSYPNADYVKDTNGLLNKFIGTWKGVFNGKSYEVNLIKKENVGDEIKWDKLIGKLKITASNGTIEFNNFNQLEDDNFFRGTNFQKNLKFYKMIFPGAQATGCIDTGTIYLGVKADTPNILAINFLADYDIVEQDCSNFQTTIPSRKSITLTKQ
ncbi:DUF6705 family protein [Chryseobacterium sp. M5A1_1a]